MQKFRTFG